MTTTATITCTITGDIICEETPIWAVTDALVNYYCDNSTPREVYDACVELGDAIAYSTPSEDALATYLACSIEYGAC